MKTTIKSYIKLLEQSFPGIEKNILRCDALGFSWEASKIFTKEENGKVVSHVALLECPMLVQGIWHKVGALHAVCSDVSYQKRGFATQLMSQALDWAKGRLDLVFLFTQIPSFYEKLMFKKVQEYRFHLCAAHSNGSQSLRKINVLDDHELFVRCFKERAPLSNKLWIRDNGLIASFNTLFATYPTYWSLYYSSSINGLLSYELQEKTLHLYDMVAHKIPSLELILDHFPGEIENIYFYFSPDLLTNKTISEPYLYDNGQFMVHGSLRLPSEFMIAPLSRC